MGKYYLGTGNQQINFQVVDSTGVINDLNLSGLYLSVTGKAADADKLDNFDSSFFRNAANLTGIYTGQISGGIGNADTLDGFDSSYFLNGANITGTVSLSGTFTGYYTGAFSGTITHTDSITFHTGLGINPDPAELTWNDDVGTMQLGLQGGNIDLRVGLQNYEYVTNRNASTLSKGSVVYISGAQGNRPAVALALANADSTSAVTFGILAEDIASMANGYAITNGLLTNLNTTGFAEGAALYLSPTVSGAVISSKPQAPSHSVLVGFCVRSHASAGEILVKIQNGVELDELHDVRITSAQNNDIIRYNAPSGVWFNSNTLALNGTGSHYISGDLGIGTSSPSAKLHIFGADKRQIITSTTDNAALVFGQWDGATNRIESSTRKLLITSYASGISLGVNGSENVHVSTSGNLGVGTTSPQFKLDVNGTASIAQSYYLNKGFADGVEEYLIRGSAGSWNGFISYTPSSSTANRGFKFGAWDNGGNRNDWVSIWNGDVGIGTTIPLCKLDVRGSIMVMDQADPSIYLSDNSTRNWVIGLNPTTDAFYIRDITEYTTRMTIDTSGNIGIGTTSPLTKLNLSGGGGAVYQTFTDTTDAYHHGYVGKNGDGLVFGFSSQNVNFITDEKMRITTSGNVGIGTTDPTQKLYVNGGNAAIEYATGSVTYTPSALNTSPRLTLIGQYSTTDTYNLIRYWSGGSHDWSAGTVTRSSGVADYIFQSYNGSAHGERVRITAAGNVGIGTASPGAKFDVRGAGGTITQNTTTSSLMTSSVTAGSSGTLVGGNDAMTLVLSSENTAAQGVGGVLGFGAKYNTAINEIATVAAILGAKESSSSGVESGYLAFGTRKQGLFIAERMRITSDGDVGIGTASPAYKLHVNVASTGVGARFNNGGNYFDIGGFSSGTAYIRGWENIVQFGNSYNGHTTFITNDTERMRIDNSGNVGIGTTSPNEKLEVGGNISVRTYSGTYGSLRFGTTNASYLDAWAGIESDWESTGVNVANLKFYTSYGSRSEKMRITSAGNIGIGTTSPVANLHIYRGVNATVATLGEVASYSTVKIGRFRADQDHSLYIGNAGSYASFLQGANDAGSNAMHILINPFGGNVGIGTTDPNTTLHVYKTTNDAVVKAQTTTAGAYFQADSATDGFYGLKLSNSGTSKWFIGGYGTSDFTFQLSEGGTEYVRIARSSGNVGIGTTSPTEKLQVAGSANIDGSINFLRGSGEYSTYIKANDYVDGGYSGSTLRYWIELGSKGGTHIVLNTDGSAAAAENAYDHFTIWQYTNGSGAIAAGARKFWITNTGRVNFIDSTWHKSSDGIERIHFGTNGTTFYKGGGSGTIHTFRNASDVDILTLSNAKDAAFAGNVTVAGNLTINGTTTTVNSTVITVDDPIITLGGDTAPTTDDNKDRGVEFKWHDGTNAKTGFFGFDDSTGYFTFIPDATNSSEVFSGTAGTIAAYFYGTADQAFTNQHNGNASQWYGRILSRNSTNDKAVFLGTYSGSVAGVFAHNNALNAWTDLYVNTTDGSTGGTVKMPSTVLVNGNQVLHAGNYNSYALPLTGGTLTGPITESSTTDQAVTLDATDNSWKYIGFSWSGTRKAYFGINASGSPQWGSDVANTTFAIVGSGSSLTIAGNTVWHAGNDGSGSGLDADLLDGYNQDTANTANTVVRRDASGNFSAGVITGTRLEARSSGTTQIYIDSTNNGSKEIVFQNNGATTGYLWQASTYLGLGGGSGSNSLFVTTSNGNVGVGTTSPAAKLEVNGDFKNGLVYRYPHSQIAPALNSTGWIKLATIPNNSRAKFLMRNGSANSEETLEFDVYSTYFNSGVYVIVTRNTYNYHLNEIQVQGTDGQPRIVYVKCRTSDYAPTFTWQVESWNGAATIHNTEETPTSGKNFVIGTAGYLHSNYVPNVYFDGNVGIGQIPATKLNVKEQNSGTEGFIVTNWNGINTVLAGSDSSSGGGKFTLKTNAGTSAVFISSTASSYFNGGNVGIGVTTPNSKLDIAYESSFDATTPGTAKYGLHFSGQATSNYATGITFTGGNAVASSAHAGIYVQGSGSYGTKMYFATTDEYAVGAKTRMIIAHNGNVGIGITTPLAKLHLYSDDTNVMLSMDGSGAPYMRFLKSGTATGYIGTAGAFSYGGNTDLGIRADNSLYVTSFGSQYFNAGAVANILVIASTGNVGIGTTTPTAAKLQISSGGISTQDSTRTFAGTTFNSAIGSSDTRTLAFNGTGGSSVWWCDSGTPSFAIDSSGGTTSFWRYSSGWVARMALDANGFGVNTTSPGVKLTTRSGTNSLPATTGTAQNGAGLRVEGGDNAVIDIGANSVDTWIQATDKSALDNYYRLLLNPRGGNVGIGVTTNPAYKLEVNGSFAATGITVAKSSGISTITFPAGFNDAGYIQHEESTNNNGIMRFSVSDDDGDNDYFTFGNTSNGYQERFRIFSNGRFRMANGIWHQSLSDGANRIFFDASARTYFGSQDGYEWRSAADSAIMCLSNGGSLGIGTTAPQRKLDILGGDIMVRSTSDTDTSVVNFGSTNYYPRASIRSTGLASPVGDANLSFWTRSGGNEYERITILNNGNVGIGTQAPSYKLEVNGSFAATTKSFVIPHPTKEGKKLRYGSLEGPENGVYIRGKTTSKVIELPDYWTKLVDPDSITVQLTPIGSHQKLYVEKIEDNKVYIANENLLAKNINCFFYILAERADVEKLQVEIDA